MKTQSPNILLAVNMISPDGQYDPLYLSNYAQINIYDELSRVPGVGLVNFLGQRQYSMRAWLDPQKLAALDLTASEVIDAISEQNVVVAAGNIGQQPVPTGQVYQLVLNTLGRLSTPEQFGEIIVKVGARRTLRPLARRGQNRSRFAELRPDLHAHDARQGTGRESRDQEVSVGRAGGVRVAVGKRPDGGRRRQGENGRAQERASPKASTTASPTTPRPSSSTRSTTCSSRSTSRRRW